MLQFVGSSKKLQKASFYGELEGGTYRRRTCFLRMQGCWFSDAFVEVVQRWPRTETWRCLSIDWDKFIRSVELFISCVNFMSSTWKKIIFLGSYCCIAKNCMGEAKSTAELTVEDIQNQLNEEERLQLLTTNQPPKFIKGLRSGEARITENFRFSVQGIFRQLYVNNLILWL